MGVNRIYNTFKTLCNNADFSGNVAVDEPEKEDPPENDAPLTAPLPLTTPQFHYNIQIICLQLQIYLFIMPFLRA